MQLKIIPLMALLLLLALPLLSSIPDDALSISECGLVSQSHSYYVLMNDITSQGTCLWVSGENITINLNSHTITYAHATFIDAPNPSFEQGSGTELVGWSGGGQRSSQSVLVGDYALFLPAGSSMTSDAIPVIPHTQYAFGGMRQHYQAEFQIINPQTNEPIPCEQYSITGQRDPWYAVVCFANIGDLDEVRLRITTQDDEFVDKTYFRPSNIHGISRVGTGYNYPGSPSGTTPNNLKILNGSIISGSSQANRAHSIFALSVSELEVSHLYAFVHGPDSSPVVSFWGADKHVHNNHFVSNTTWMYNRHYPGNFLIDLRSSGGSEVLVHDNYLENGPQSVIGVTSDTAHIRVYNNTLVRGENAALYANNYAIRVSGASPRKELSNNTISGYGRGIHITSSNMVVSNNYIDVTDRPVPDFPTGLMTHGIKIEGSGARNAIISNNTVIARSMTNSGAAHPLDITVTNFANITIVNNSFTALYADRGGAYGHLNMGTAYASIATTEHPHILLHNNLFRSNHLIIYSSGGSNVLFTNNVFEKLEPSVQDHFGLFWSGVSENISFINSTFINVDPKMSRHRPAGGVRSNFSVLWYYDVLVVDSHGSPLEGAMVSATNSQGTFWSEVTDTEGEALLVLPQYHVEGMGSWDMVVTERPSYEVLVDFQGEQISSHIYMNESISELFVFGGSQCTDVCLEGQTFFVCPEVCSSTIEDFAIVSSGYGEQYDLMDLVLLGKSFS